MNQDVKIKLSSINGQLFIVVNDILVYAQKLKENKLRGVVGIRYSFHGSGGINKLIIKNENHIFLNEPFSE